jgi:DNA-binding CsgD family transcriptional regulator/signal transduction histidine kinase
LQERYRLTQWLGEGSMGVVYQAQDELLDRPVAIKFLAPRRLAQGEALARFLREARAVARLAHPHIMGVFDVGQAGEWHYLVLEFVPGRDLAAVLQEGALAVNTAVAHTRAILQALRAAHGQGIIHRDIKPENIMITPDGQAKVMDFGVALSLHEARLTMEGAIVGTTLYLSPEQVQGQAATVQTDLYAVGALFYEMLTGQPPFSGESLAAILAQIVHQPPPLPRQINPAIPQAIEQVVLQLLAKEVNGRYPTAQAALEALTAANQPASTTNKSPNLITLAAWTETADALEAERQRLAQLVENQVMGPLNLLLAQTAAYEQSMAGNQMGQLAVSVLGTLARQLMQQVRDLTANLQPTTLTSLGLAAALEGLANQVLRRAGAQVTLDLARLPERLPAPLELALFRAAQEGVETAVSQAHATHISIRLAHEPEQLAFYLGDDGGAAVERLPTTGQRLTQLGGKITGQPGQLTIQFGLKAAVELTPRELEVLQLVAYGLSNKEIAQRLSLSARTVNFHLDNVYSKLGVSSRTEAAVMALRQGWVRGTQG